MRFGILSLILVIGMSGCDHSPAKPAPQAAAPPELPAVPTEKIEKSLAAAQEYINSQDAEKARAILITLIDRAPNETRAHELYGQTLMIMALQADRKHNDVAGKALRAQAYEQYKTAVQLDPQNPGLRQSAGQIVLEAGDKAAALEHFEKAAQLDPTNPQFPLFAAQLLIQAKRYDEAKAKLARVLKIDPDEAIAHASLAMIAVEENQFDVALTHMAEARKIEPDDVGLRAQEAKIYRRKNEPKRALELLVGLGAAERGQEMVANEIAASYELMGDPMKAAKAWQHCFQSNLAAPRAWFAAVRAGELLLKAGEHEQALMFLQQAQMAAPQAAEVKALAAALGR